jgi:hypothetical protein
MILAASMGVLRQVENLTKGRAPAFGAGRKNDWQLHIEGCMGEFAAAKALNCFPYGLTLFRGSDLGSIEVRTRSEDWHDLILHPEDKDGAKYLLVCGLNGLYSVKGFIHGRDGKREEYWKDPAGGRAAFFVPQAELHDYREMPV